MHRMIRRPPLLIALISVKDVEDLTGEKFLKKLSPSEEKIRSNFNMGDWKETDCGKKH